MKRLVTTLLTFAFVLFSPIFAQNYSLEFDGVDDYATIPQIFNGQSTDEITIEFWLKTDEYQDLFSSIYAKSYDWKVLFFDVNHDNIGDHYLNFGLSQNNIHTFVQAEVNYADNQWHHICGTFEKGLMNLFFDGMLVASGTSPNEYIEWIQTEQTLMSAYNGNQPFKGIIDYFHIQSGIKYFENFTPNYYDFNNDSEIYFNFNDGIGDEISDITNNEFNGTIYGATWSEDVPDIDVTIYGCTDPCYVEYNEEATIDIGSCTTWGGCPDNGDYSMEFFGNEKIIIPNNNSLELSDKITIEVWVKNISDDCSLISKGEGSSSTFLLHYGANTMPDNTIRWHIKTEDMGWQYRDSETTVNPEEWTHIASTYDGNEMKIFVNGELNEFVLNGGNLINNNEDIEIGSHSGSYNLIGLIDNVHISDTIRYTDSFTPEFSYSVDQHTRAFYTFNEGEGDAVYDLSGNGNHGTVYGATWSEDALDIDTQIPPVDSGLFTYGGELNGHYYYISNGRDSWQNAQIECENQGGHLVTFSSENENNFIYNIIPQNPYASWIGLFQNTESDFFVEPDGGWEWVTNEEFSYLNWYNGEPNEVNGNTNCCEMPYGWNGGWNDNDCDLEKYYVLEIENELSDPVITIQLDSISAFIGDTVQIPITIELDNSYSSAEFSISGYADGLNYIDVTTENTMTNGWSVETNESDDLLQIAMYGSDNISGSGVLCNLDFIVEETASGFVPLILIDVLFDETTTNIQITSGGVEIIEPEGPTASFIIEPSFGYLPLEIVFTNSSNLGNGEIVSYLWDFGDESSSSEENPTHTYISMGEYEVSFTVTTTFGNDTSTDTILSGIAGDVSLNEEVHAYDASLILKYLVDEISLTNLQLFNGEVSLNDTLTAYDASLIAQYVVDSIDTLPAQESIIALGDVTMIDVALTSNEIIEVPIIISNSENIYSFESQVSFNNNILEFVDVEWSELVDGFNIEVRESIGILKIAGAGTHLQNNDGLFATLEFLVNDFENALGTIVSLDKLRFNENPELFNVAEASLISLLTNEEFHPTQFALYSVYPNPFNPTTTISFALPQESVVSITVYNMQGSEVATLTNGNYSVGSHQVIWDATSNASGTYFVKMVADNFVDTQKIVLVK